MVVHSETADDDDSDPGLLAADDALEEIDMDDVYPAADDDDEEDDDGNEAAAGLRPRPSADSNAVAYFDGHRDSVFALAMHPTVPTLIATGASDGPADDAPGCGYVLDLAAAPSPSPPPVLPGSYAADPHNHPNDRPHPVPLAPLCTLDGHTDSIVAVSFSLPAGRVLYSAGMDGRLRAYAVTASPNPASPSPSVRFLAEAHEVPEINWLSPCPKSGASAAAADAVALGASDGSVWVYVADPAAPAGAADALSIVQSFYLHTASCTAGAWSADGALLVTVSADGTLHVNDIWVVFPSARPGASLLSLAPTDQRFAVPGGLFAVAVEPAGTFAAVGGDGGAIRVVSLPRAGGSGAGATAGGQVLAAVQLDGGGSIETLAFSAPTASLLLLAAGGSDGSIALLDASHHFALRRRLPRPHAGDSVVRLAFAAPWLLTSCGLDGVVRRWDLRSGAAAAADDPPAVPVAEWHGHAAAADGAGGVLDFVQGPGGHPVVTAGDDGLVLVF